MKSINKQGIMNVSLFLCLLPMPAFASADVASTLSNFLGYLTGPLGKSISALAIVGVGFGCFVMGRIPKSWVISTVIGIGVIFGANTIFTTLVG